MSIALKMGAAHKSEDPDRVTLTFHHLDGKKAVRTGIHGHRCNAPKPGKNCVWDPEPPKKFPETSCDFHETKTADEDENEDLDGGGKENGGVQAFTPGMG